MSEVPDDMEFNYEDIAAKFSPPGFGLPPCDMRFSHREGKPNVWDELRGCWLVLTPEEWVRRHLLAMLTRDMGVFPALVSQECPVRLHGMGQRADVVVYGRDARPRLLAECKAPGVKITQATLDQAFRYNSVLGARYLMLTNGMKHFLFEKQPDGSYSPIRDFAEVEF